MCTSLVTAAAASACVRALRWLLRCTLLFALLPFWSLVARWGFVVGEWRECRARVCACRGKGDDLAKKGVGNTRKSGFYIERGRDGVRMG